MFELVIACYFGKLNLTLGSVVPLAMFVFHKADAKHGTAVSDVYLPHRGILKT